MPVYVYERSDGSRMEVLQGLRDAPLTVCPETGLDCRKIVAPFRAWLPEYDRPEHEAFNARQKAWLDRPEQQARIKSGELIPDDRHEGDFPEATSSITEQAKLGVL